MKNIKAILDELEKDIDYHIFSKVYGLTAPTELMEMSFRSKFIASLSMSATCVSALKKKKLKQYAPLIP